MNLNVHCSHSRYDISIQVLKVWKLSDSCFSNLKWVWNKFWIFAKLLNSLKLNFFKTFNLYFFLFIFVCTCRWYCHFDLIERFGWLADLLCHPCDITIQPLTFHFHSPLFWFDFELTRPDPTRSNLHFTSPGFGMCRRSNRKRKWGNDSGKELRPSGLAHSED